MTKKPVSFRILQTLLLLRLIFSVALIVVFAFVMNTSDNNRLAAGIRDGIISALKLEASDTAFALGYLIGAMLFPMAFVVMNLVFLNKRNYKAVVGLSIADLLFAIAGGFPLFSLIGLILVLTNPTKAYLKGKDESIIRDSEAASSLDGDNLQ
jgi:hypothetical protein